MPRLFTIVSVAGHAVVVAIVLVAQLLAVGTLPVPRVPLTFEDVRYARLTDIQLPAPHRSAKTGDPASTVSPRPAPIEALHYVPDDF